MVREIFTHCGTPVLVDDEDYEWLAAFRWYLHPASKRRNVSYAVRNALVGGKRRNIRMHREIMKPPPGFVVDHIDHDGLHNCRSNLRVCTQSQNSSNSRPRARALSRFLGVSPYRRKWTARAYGQYLGLFATEEDAARAYDAFKLTHAGDFASLNFPDVRSAGPDTLAALLTPPARRYVVFAEEPSSERIVGRFRSMSDADTCADALAKRDAAAGDPNRYAVRHSRRPGTIAVYGG